MLDFLNLEARPYFGAIIKNNKNRINWRVTIIPPVAPSKK